MCPKDLWPKQQAGSGTWLGRLESVGPTSKARPSPLCGPRTCGQSKGQARECGGAGSGTWQGRLESLESAICSWQASSPPKRPGFHAPPEITAKGYCQSPCGSVSVGCNKGAPTPQAHKIHKAHHSRKSNNRTKEQQEATRVPTSHISPQEPTQAHWRS